PVDEAVEVGTAPLGAEAAWVDVPEPLVLVVADQVAVAVADDDAAGLPVIGATALAEFPPVAPDLVVVAHVVVRTEAAGLGAGLCIRALDRTSRHAGRSVGRRR